MGLGDRRVDRSAKFPQKILPLTYSRQVAADQTDLEIASVRVPWDCQIVRLDVWARAVSGANAKTVTVYDDAGAITGAVTVVQGAQTNVPLTASPTRLKSGSELRVLANTGATTTIDDIVVTAVVRPYPLGEAGVALT